MNQQEIHHDCEMPTMPKICAIALTLICLVTTVADTPGVGFVGGPAMTTEELPAAPREAVEWPNILLASDTTIAHPVDRATWAPLSMNAAEALEREETQAEEFAAGSVGDARYDHPTLLFRIGTSRHARTSNMSGGGTSPSGSSGSGGAAGSGPSQDDAKGDGGSPAPADPTTGSDTGSGPIVPGDNDSPAHSDNPPANGDSPTDAQPDAGNTTPDGPGDAAPPATEAPPSNTDTPPVDDTPPDHGNTSPPGNEPASPEETPPPGDESPAPSEEPSEEPNETPVPTHPWYPVDDVPGHGTPVEVPEPSSLGLLGIGLLGLLARRRRRAS